MKKIHALIAGLMVLSGVLAIKLAEARMQAYRAEADRYMSIQKAYNDGVYDATHDTIDENE